MKEKKIVLMGGSLKRFDSMSLLDVNSSLISIIAAKKLVISYKLNSLSSKKIIKRFYFTSSVNYMYIIKRFLKKDKNDIVKNYSTNAIHKYSNNIKDDHPKNFSLCREKKGYNNYDGDISQVNIIDINYSHSFKIEDSYIGIDKNNKAINYITNKGKIIMLNDQKRSILIFQTF